MTDDEHWSDRGNQTPKFNKARQAPPAKEEPLSYADDDRPPIHGLQDGPKPPAGIREAVNAEVRAQQARERAYERMAKRDETSYNNQMNKQNSNQKGDDGKGIGD